MGKTYNNSFSLMKKWRVLITAFSNTQLGRDYLFRGDTKKPPISEQIDLLLPNGYHQIEGFLDKKTLVVKAVFIPGNIYEIRVYKALHFVDRLYATPTSDPFLLEEQLQFLCYFLKLSQYAPSWSSKRMMQFCYLTAIFNPSATAIDGQMTASPGDSAIHEDWSVIWSNSATNIVNHSSSGDTQRLHLLAASSTSNKYDYAQWAMMLFDTSSMTHAARLIPGSNTMQVYMTSVSNDWSQNLHLVDAHPASDSSLTTNDYGSARGTIDQASPVSQGSFSTNAYSGFILNTTGEANVAPDGITRFGMIDDAVFNNSAPSWANGKLDTFIGQYAHGTHPEKLTIVYTLPIGPFPTFFNS